MQNTQRVPECGVRYGKTRQGARTREQLAAGRRQEERARKAFEATTVRPFGCSGLGEAGRRQRAAGSRQNAGDGGQEARIYLAESMAQETQSTETGGRGH